MKTDAPIHVYQPPDYLNSGLIDNDIKELFLDKTYKTSDILLAQLIRELQKASEQLKNKPASTE